MYKPRNVAEWGIAAAVLALVLAATTMWLGYGGSEPRVAKDYEDCAADAQANASSNIEYNKSVTRCSERFAGRRKAGGGYTYFDFMQNRSFDIAGPNPTDGERKKIDRSYMEFLGSQRREMFLSDLAKAQANEEQADLRRGRPNAGAPLDLAPRIPLPAKRPLVERPKPCGDGSLSCSWAKLTAAVKNAFASSAGKNQ
jgi:hypothetical protein